MAYENFIPEVWAAGIERDLERKCVFAEDCNRKYEGDVKAHGDSVRILGVGAPTIYDTTDKHFSLSDAETVEDTSIVMPIRQIAYYNYKIDDIDKRQAVGGVMEALSAETSQKLADRTDRFIANLATNPEAEKYAASAVALTSANILGELDKVQQKLWERDVPVSADIIITISPWVYTLLRQAYRELDTNNHELLKNGFVGMYNNMKIKMSNNVAVTGTGSNAVTHIMARTKNAIAFAQPMTHVEAYRPENGFSDAVKGFILYDGKIVRPKEMLVMNVKQG